MKRRLASHLVAGLAVAAWVAGIAAFASATGALQDVTPRVERIASEAERHSPRTTEGVTRLIDEVTGTAWRAVRFPLLIILSAAGASLASRALHQRNRLQRMRRFELRLGREDVASPYKREKLFDAWHGQLSARWWRRAYAGQPPLALELHHGSDGTQRLVLAAIGGMERMLEGRLQETYPDVRLVALRGAPPWTGHITRLKKRALFVARLQTVKDDEQTICESIVSTMAALAEPATVQFLLAPAPWSAHALSRWLLKRRERELTRAERERGDDVGIDSVVEDKELKGALETQHRSLYFADIRIASDDQQATSALAGVFSEARSENALVQREARLRRWLYAARLASCAPNPLPSFLHGVLSSSELAALWGLPRQRAKAATLIRSPVRRAPAPPAITRTPEFAVMRDERGPVGLHPQDRKYGLALIGGQGVGKTSTMARTIAIDAQDRDAALIVLDPKHELAEHALALVPADRTVWHMDLARPEIGIDPLGVDASPGVVADMLVAALREAHADGAILAASDRFLRHAAMAVCAVEERPTLWHMLELLSPRRDPYRERVAAGLARLPEQAALLRYWATSFPELWQDATRGQLAMALDAPRNKLERLITTVEVDKALRHPFPIDLRQVVQRRQVLIVNGALGEVGQDNAVTVMQLIIQLLHQALKQQQRLPPSERPRVCLKVDEAHLVLTPSFAELLALHRAAGLEVTAAWQYNAQLQDGVIRSGLRSLLRSVSMFSMGEVRDARDQAEIAMEVYTDSIKTEREDLERLRISPDDVVRLPVHTAVNSWVAQGARRSAFIAKTLAMGQAADDQLRAHHLARQRQAGAQWPTALPPPKEVAPAAPADDSPAAAAPEDPPKEPSTLGAAKPVPVPGGSPDDGAPPAPARSARRRHGTGKTSRTKKTAPNGDGPPSYRAVHREDMTGIVWDRREPDPELGRALEPTNRDLELLRALWERRFLLTSQIAVEWWPDNDPSAAQRRLTRLARAGWVRRFRPTVIEGNHEWIYQLAPAGFALAQRHHGPEGAYIQASVRFAERTPTDHRPVAHDLQVNAWVYAYRQLAAGLVADWRGPDHAAVEVPTKRDKGRRARPLELADVRLEGYLQIRDLRRGQFARVSPDATLSIELPTGRSFDLTIELDRTRRPRKNDSKLLRYDALITAWWRAVPRYLELGEPPAVVFVCQDQDDVLALMQLADSQVTGCLANPGDPPARWRYPGRERTLFVSERDIHERIPRASMLPTLPAGARPKGGFVPRAVELPKDRE